MKDIYYKEFESLCSLNEFISTYKIKREDIISIQNLDDKHCMYFTY